MSFVSPKVNLKEDEERKGNVDNFVLLIPCSEYLLQFISPHDYFLTANGVLLEDSDNISCTRNSFRVLRAHPLLLGGKGGKL